MISTPDRRRWPATCLGLALLVAGPGVAAPGAGYHQLVAQARQELAGNDAIAAEAALQRAVDVGAPRGEVAALMGEALLDQDVPDRAAIWLRPGQFSPDTAALGFRQLARLERMSGDLAAAGRAFDRAIALTPRDAAMWVEIGRLRYAGGEHMLALDAAAYALRLDPRNVRALEFQGQIVRDRDGLVTALPWFVRARKAAPNDLSVLGEYAATLGDLGRGSEMLAATRAMLDIDPKNARAFFLQAVLATRAGNAPLARSLLNRVGDRLDDVPAVMLLEGTVELRAGNYQLAIDVLSRLMRLQPANGRARLLLARAMDLAGEQRLLISDFAPSATGADASRYMLTLLGRTYEAQGRRDLAAPLLDRAAADSGQPEPEAISPSADAGLLDDAINPDSVTVQLQAGDVLFARGDAPAALAHYALASRVRLPEGLMLRMATVYRRTGRSGEAMALAERFLKQHPGSASAARMAAELAADMGDWRRARSLLEGLQVRGGADDPDLLIDLSLAQLRSGDAAASEQSARAAYRLQRASPKAAAAWGASLAALHKRPRAALALLDKARAMSGDSALLAEARGRTAELR